MGVPFRRGSLLATLKNVRHEPGCSGGHVRGKCVVIFRAPTSAGQVAFRIVSKDEKKGD